MPLEVQKFEEIVDRAPIDQINPNLNELAERFCERKALKCLFRFLPAYFSINGLTDGWEMCLSSLKDLRALCRDDLTKEEAERINETINLIHKMLDNRN